MIAIVIAIIVLVIMLLFFVIMLMLTKRETTTLTTIDENGKIKDEKGSIDRASETMTSSSRSSKRGTEEEKEAIRKEDMFKFMEFDRILDDMIVQKGGVRFTKAIKCKGINYDLMSEVEQLAVEEGFITFLNTLKYPIQLYVQAQNVDLRKTMEVYRKNIVGIEENYNDVNMRYQKMVSSFDTDERKLQELTKEKDSVTNVYEYAKDMIKYVEKMDKNKKMLQRSFYILVSYSTSDISSVEKFNKNELIDMCSTELTTRCQAIISALSSCSVSGSILNSNELAELLYNAYNRDEAGVMSVKDNIESGFFRLYSESEDAFTKKQEALEEYLNNQARLKALEAIKYSILNNEYETPAKQQLDEEEEVSKRATAMVNYEDYEPDFKDKVNKKILSDFRETKKELLAEDANQKRIVVEQSKSDMEELEKVKAKVEEYEKENNIVKSDKKEEVSKEVEENVEKVEDKEEVKKIETKEEVETAPNIYSESEQSTNEEDESIV